MSLNEENPVRLQVWRRALGVEDAKITNRDIEAQNGVIHIINKVIVPSNQSIEDILTEIPDREFNTFLGAIVTVTGSDTPLLNLRPGDEAFYTFFVPSDRAFRELDSATLRKIRTDSDYARELVKSHVAVNMYPETSFEQNLIYTINGMHGPFDVKKTDYNVLMVNNEEVRSSHMSAHGVIHVIDKVFLPENSYTYSSFRRTVTTYGDGGAGGRSSSSSSSSSSSTTSSRRTYRTRVTFSDSQGGRNLPVDLPSFPQGTVLSGATKRKASRGPSRRRNSSSSSTSISSSSSSSFSDEDARGSYNNTTVLEEPDLHRSGSSVYESEPSGFRPRDPYDFPEEPTASTTEPGLRGSGYGSISVTTYNNSKKAEGAYTVVEGSYSSPSYNPSASSPSVSSVYSTYSSHNQINPNEGDDAEGPRRGDSSQRSFSRGDSSSSYDSSSGRTRFEVSGPQSQGSEGSYSYSISNGSTSGYDYSGGAGSESLGGSGYSGGSRFHSGSNTNPGDARVSSTSFSRTYSYNYTGNPEYKLHTGKTSGDLSPSNYGLGIYTSDSNSSSSSSSQRKNTIGPVSPDGGRFSYVGHSYGQDVIGHSDPVVSQEGDAPLPLSGVEGLRSLDGGVGEGRFGRRKFESSHTSRIEGGEHGSGGLSGGVVTNGRSGTNRKYSVTRTHSKSERRYTYPVQDGYRLSVRRGDKDISSVSANALTSDFDRMYADGAELAEATGAEETISRKEAAALRRRWRLKRHHKRRGGKRRRGRKGGRRRAQSSSA